MSRARDPLPDGLEALLTSEDWEERETGLRRAGRWVRTVPTPELRARLTEHLTRLAKDTKWEVRAGVARLLQDFEPDGFDELIQALRQDQHAHVIRYAERALRKWRRVARDQERQERQWGRWVARETKAAPEVMALVRSAVQQLAHGVAHDLRREAQALGEVSNTFRAGRHYKAQEPLLARLDLIVDQLRAFATDIGDYASRTGATVARESLREITRQAIDMACAGREPGVELVVEVGDLWAEVPRGGLVRALGNLIRNALEATPPGGRVRIFARELGEQLEIQIEDNGQGMHPSDVQAIFAPLTSTKKGSATEVHTGMGLAIAERVIVDDCGGELEVLRTVWGEGTTIGVRLPLGPGA